MFIHSIDPGIDLYPYKPWLGGMGTALLGQGVLAAGRGGGHRCVVILGQYLSNVLSDCMSALTTDEGALYSFQGLFI